MEWELRKKKYTRPLGVQIYERVCRVFADFEVSAKEGAKVLGINTYTVYAWRSKGYTPSAKTLLKLNQEYDVNINWLLTGKGEMYVRYVADEEDEYCYD